MRDALMALGAVLIGVTVAAAPLIVMIFGGME